MHTNRVISLKRYDKYLGRKENNRMELDDFVIINGGLEIFL